MWNSIFCEVYFFCHWIYKNIDYVKRIGREYRLVFYYKFLICISSNDEYVEMYMQIFLWKFVNKCHFYEFKYLECSYFSERKSIVSRKWKMDLIQFLPFPFKLCYCSRKNFKNFLLFCRLFPRARPPHSNHNPQN